MKAGILLLSLTIYSICFSQNIGINTTTSNFPLSFSSTLGDKVSLWGVSGNHYGFGIQSGLLQIHSDAAGANIGFGYGSSSSFTERMRITNSGGDGLLLNGRIILKNGTSPLDPAYGAGIWMYKADNTNLLGFIGVQNNQNLGFFGGPAGWGFTYDAINSRVGIGNNSPNAPLAFPPALGKKITLYPGATGDVGFAVAGNRLQIYSDNPNADVAIGYDAAGTFNERFAFKPNGALALNGNIGTSKQVLVSNGNSAADWTTLGNIMQTAVNGTCCSGITTSASLQEIPGSAVTITVAFRSRLIYSANFQGWGPNCALCADGSASISMAVNNVTISNNTYRLYAPPGTSTQGTATIANYFIDVEAGTYTIVSKATTAFSFQPIGPLYCLQASIIALPRD